MGLLHGEGGIQAEWSTVGRTVRGWRKENRPRDARRAPQCRMLMSVFHPNLDGASVCIGDFWAVSEVLDDLVILIGRVIVYRPQCRPTNPQIRHYRWRVDR